MAATLKELANRLDLSISTVSYALNGGPRSISPEVKERVLALADELGYSPNKTARSLATKRSNMIGIVPPGFGNLDMISPYFHHCLNAISSEASLAGQDLVLFTHVNSSLSPEVIRNLLGSRADGFIFVAPTVSASTLGEAVARHIPTVVIGVNTSENFSCVMADNRMGVRQAMQHLWNLGHRRIAHLYGQEEMQDGRERRAAFTEWAAEYNLHVPSEWQQNGRFTPSDARTKALTILSAGNRPTAFFCANDEMALGTMSAAYELKIRIPDDLSIIGFDNTYQSAITSPGMTTVRQPIDTMCAEAVRTLLAIINGESQVESQLIPTELVIRNSTARPMEDN